MHIFSVNIFGITIAPTYYGLMYAIGIIAGYLIVKKRGKIKNELIEDLILSSFLGIILGGRLGYVLFYNLEYFIQKPLDIFKIWEGGMSFHGGMLGVIIATFIVTKIKKTDFLRIIDQIALVAPIGLATGRIGNLINKELLGREYSGIFAVQVGDKSYFPSPLIESLTEGLALFLIMNIIYNHKGEKPGLYMGIFLLGYSIFRIIVEMFFRLPDSNIGYIFGHVSLGQILSFPMIIAGIILIIFSIKKQKGIN